jgi:hypothetical protein
MENLFLAFYVLLVFPSYSCFIWLLFHLCGWFSSVIPVQAQDFGFSLIWDLACFVVRSHPVVYCPSFHFCSQGYAGRCFYHFQFYILLLDWIFACRLLFPVLSFSISMVCTPARPELPDWFFLRSFSSCEFCFSFSSVDSLLWAEIDSQLQCRLPASVFWSRDQGSRPTLTSPRLWSRHLRFSSRDPGSLDLFCVFCFDLRVRLLGLSIVLDRVIFQSAILDAAPALGLPSILPPSICSSAQGFTSALGASCRSAALVHARVIYSAASLSLLMWTVCRVDLVRAQRLQGPVACCVLSALSLFKSFDFCVNHCREKTV